MSELSLNTALARLEDKLRRGARRGESRELYARISCTKL
jgi:hypothetical protein